MFFCAPNNMFGYTIMHLTSHAPEIVMHECMLMCTLPCTYCKDKVKVRSISLTINPEPSLGIQTLFCRERNNRQVPCLPRTKQPDNFPSTMFEGNEHGWSFPVFVGLRQQVRLLANILIRTSRLCRNRDFAQITHTPSNTHIMG